MSFSIDQLDYIQRTGVWKPDKSGDLSGTQSPKGRALWRVKGIGRIKKQKDSETVEQKHLPSEDVLMGMYGSMTPLSFCVWGESGEVAIHLGTWLPPSSSSVDTVETDQEVLPTALNGLYPSISLQKLPQPERALSSFASAPRSGLVIGIPTAKSPDSRDRALPLDRLIRAMSGSNWAFLILAEPASEGTIGVLRRSVIEEMRQVQSEALAAGTPSPLAEHYNEMLKVGLNSLTTGLAVGAWHTAVYLLGDEESYSRLAGLWAGIFSGEGSLREPVRVLHSSSTSQLAVNWSLPSEPGRQGPGHYKHPFQFQTLLTSDQLAAYIHLPELETQGFVVESAPRFDVIPSVVASNEKIVVGEVLIGKQRTSVPYEIELESLKKHVFVAGVTGAGKTRTIFRLLKQAFAARVPFLVIEPAKREYREMLNHPEVGEKLQVFTIGDETLSPLRLNPLEVLPGTSIAAHIDLIKSVFSASFGLWTPLPQVLETCLHEVYRDRGWDVTRNLNSRTSNKYDPLSFPTLSELIGKVDEVIPRLGFDKDAEAVGRIRGSLLTRLNSLRNGGKGRMLDSQESVPMDLLVQRPTVLELEGMGDDDDKAFMMGLFLIRLVEHLRQNSQRRQSQTQQSGQASTVPLQHLLVLEEAHRLLTNVGTSQERGEGNPRGKAVESFANLLSEIRAYGQGVIIADQVPVKLARDVIKNTNLKVAHRVVDKEDREVLAGSMVMDKEQAEALATLKPGQAAVFAEGDDSPLLLQGRFDKQVDERPVPDNQAIAADMQEFRTTTCDAAVFQPHRHCADTGPSAGAACEAARSIVENETFRRDLNRLVLSVIDDESALGRLWPVIQQYADEPILAGIEKKTLMNCLIARAAEWFAGRRGSQAGWFYAQTAELSEKLYQALLAQFEERDPANARKSLKECLLGLHARPYPPFSYCKRICDQKSPLCLYRHAVADLVAKGDFIASWKQADPVNTNKAKDTWAVCRNMAESLVEVTDAQADAFRRVGLCSAQMMFNTHETLLIAKRREALLDGLYRQADTNGKA